MAACGLGLVNPVASPSSPLADFLAQTRLRLRCDELDPGVPRIQLTEFQEMTRYLLVATAGSDLYLDLTGNTSAGAQGPWNWQISRGFVPHPAPKPHFARPPRVPKVPAHPVTAAWWAAASC